MSSILPRLPLKLLLLASLSSCVDGRITFTGDTGQRRPRNPDPRPVPPAPDLTDPPTILIRGRVLDLANSPLGGARVRVQGSDDVTRTDASGVFALRTARTLPLVVTAADGGFFTGSTDVIDTVTSHTVKLSPVWTTDNPAYVFLHSTECASCHGIDYAEWNASNMHASGVNLWVHDVHNGGGTAGGSGGFVYKRDSFHLPRSPTGDCANCHQPVRAARAPGSTDLAPVTDPEAQEGVTCDVCHKTYDLDLGKARWPGVDPLKTKMRRPQLDGNTQPLIFGSLDDSTYRAGPMASAYSEMMESGSRLCAACHEDSNDSNQNGRFDDPTDVPSEMTYSEWAASPYASGSEKKSCADCHMPNTTGRRTIANFGSVVLRNPSRVHGHRFEGTTPAMVRSAADMTLAATSLPGRRVRVDVAVENVGAGHSFPTGVHIRNVILLVEATQSGAPLVQLTGPRIEAIAGVGNPAQGDLAGLPGRAFTRVYRDARGNSGVFYSEAVSVHYDTRIRAKGMSVSSYEFAVPAAGQVDVRAVLLYRRAYRDFVKAKGWTTDGHGNPLPDVQAPDFGLKVVEKTQVVLVP